MTYLIQRQELVIEHGNWHFNVALKKFISFEKNLKLQIKWYVVTKKSNMAFYEIPAGNDQTSFIKLFISFFSADVKI